jgi:hypothetical protein
MSAVALKSNIKTVVRDHGDNFLNIDGSSKTAYNNKFINPKEFYSENLNANFIDNSTRIPIVKNILPIDVIVENEHVYVNPCNHWSTHLSIDQYKKNIKNIQNTLKTKFHKCCGICSNEEKYGARSRRQAVNQFHKDNQLLLDKIQSIGLRYGTLCNSKCIICSHVRSSGWINDSIELGVDVNPKFLFKKNKMPGVDFLFTQFDLSDLKYVEFHGGEPLMQTYPLEFLKKIKNLKQLVVKFNTNLTVLPSQQLQEILKKCKPLHLCREPFWYILLLYRVPFFHMILFPKNTYSLLLNRVPILKRLALFHLYQKKKLI